MLVGAGSPAATFSSCLAGNGRGKHRTQADLKRLDLESRYLQEELQQLQKIDKSSAVCEEMLSNMETRPDPLLPLTNGPLNPTWDRWFQAAPDSNRCRCWIL